LLNGFFLLEKYETTEDLRNIEAIMVLRILNNLGYIGGGESLKGFVSSPFDQDLVFAVAGNRAKVLSHINKALKETHL